MACRSSISQTRRASTPDRTAVPTRWQRLIRERVEMRAICSMLSQREQLLKDVSPRARE